MKKSSNFVFDPANDRNIVEKTRLVIYDNVKKEFSHFKILEANEVYEMPFEELENHFNYKYKYQLLEDKAENPRWVDSGERYQSLIPEIVDDSGLKYAYFAPVEPSDKLIICFQPLKLRPGYNHIRLLENVNVHRLYVKEGNGRHKLTKTSFYLNENNPIPVSDLVQQLIGEYAAKLDISKQDTIFFGRSQGGFGALYHAYLYGGGHVISGEPPYFLGEFEELYKLTSLSFDDSAGFFEAVLGRPPSEESKNYANQFLTKVIEKANPPYPKVNILIGNNTSYNQKQLEPFLEWMREHDIPPMYMEKENYDHHHEMSKYFPDYLLKELDKIINNSES